WRIASCARGSTSHDAGKFAGWPIGVYNYTESTPIGSILPQHRWGHVSFFRDPQDQYSRRTPATLVTFSLITTCTYRLQHNVGRLLRNAFNAFDQEKKGCIGTQMVGTILSMLGHQLDDKMLKEIIDEVDADGSGELEFEEFVTLAARFMVEEDAEAMQQELKEAFRLYDKEGNGYITTQVLREILKELDDNLTNEDLDMMIEEIDSDGSGTVDFDEFMEVMTGGDD
uniref:EF-hand domain-containing protein n=1 Tax=Anopheles atroparvus TaxID=41427 RepID=A0A182J6V0_ANOAO